MKTSVNLTIIFCAVAFVMAVGIAGGVVLTITDKDATAFYGFFSTAFVSIIGFGGLVYGQNKANAKLETIKANVNGNLSRMFEVALKNSTSRAEVHEARQAAESAGIDTSSTGNIPLSE